MSLAPGTRLGPYEIISSLGAGGMGEVYRARDTRLGRDVAVKVLPDRLSSNPGVRARFEREARAVSSLNHPNICTLFDVGREGSIDFLVMELIEGETLSDRLARGPLPTGELLRIGAQIAAALDRAHRAGVVHRDLKPGNVMLTKSGAKLMDFGLAKPADHGVVAPGLTVAPTATSPLTADGAIVGTFQYMPPEQLEGKEADGRSDLFALGLVIYEMATGRRAFEGATQASLIAAILKDEPRPISAISTIAPAGLDRLVRQCLRKDPDERIQSAHDVRLRLDEIAEAGPSAGPGADGATRRGRRRELAAWATAALAVMLAVAFRAGSPAKPAAATPVLVASIATAEGTDLLPGIPSMALTRDGTRLAFVARGPGGSGLWIRALDETDPRLLAASDDAECPFWSPDGKFIGFHSGGQLRRIDVAGGSSEVLATMSDCFGASWEEDGFIYFVPDRRSPIMKIPASGGQATTIELKSTAGTRMYTQPSLLPDRRHILYTVNETWEGGSDSGIYVATVDGREEKRLLPVLSNARFVPPGVLVYGREGSLRAQKFDPDRLALDGDPRVLLEGVQYIGFYQSHLFTIADTGRLAYVAGRGAPARQLTWVDRKGEILGTVGEPGNYFSPRISRDGRRVAYDLSETTTDSGDIWTYDLERRIPTRLTFDPRNESAPVWSPDDRRLLFFADYPGHSDLVAIAADGAGKAETVLSNGASNVAGDWSKDGNAIILESTSAGGARADHARTDLVLYRPADKQQADWMATPFGERQARFSPDGNWISYESNESGRDEVYVRGIASGGKWRVSTDGGGSAVWRRDGRELFYLSRDSRIMSVTVRPGATFDVSSPVPLFRIPGDILDLSIATQYDVTPDGQRFLMNLNARDRGKSRITFVSNWTSLSSSL